MATINHTPFLFVLSSQKLEPGPSQVEHSLNAATGLLYEASQHLCWMVPAPSTFLFFSIAAPKSCQSVSVFWPTTGSPLPTSPPVKLRIKNNFSVSSGQPVLFLVRKCSVCICVHVWRRRSVCSNRGGGSRGGVCVGIHIYIPFIASYRRMCLCVCVCTYVPLCACLNGVQLPIQGSCSAAGCCDVIRPPHHCVFTPV